MSGITGAAQVYADLLQVWSAGRKLSGTFVRTARFQALLQRMHDAITLDDGEMLARLMTVDCCIIGLFDGFCGNSRLGRGSFTAE